MRISDWSSDVCSSDLWRSAGRTFPVIVVSARGDWTEKVEGIEAGADDYLAKPFQMGELVARVRGLVRRGAGKLSPVIEIGRLSLATEIGRASCRERVCQYVWISVVAVSLKKKTINLKR